MVARGELLNNEHRNRPIWRLSLPSLPRRDSGGAGHSTVRHEPPSGWIFKSKGVLESQDAALEQWLHGFAVIRWLPEKQNRIRRNFGLETDSQGAKPQISMLVIQRFAKSRHLHGSLKLRTFWKAKTQLLKSHEAATWWKVRSYGIYYRCNPLLVWAKYKETAGILFWTSLDQIVSLRINFVKRDKIHWDADEI